MEVNHFGKGLSVNFFSKVKLFLFNPFSDELNELRASHGLPITNNVFER